MMSCQFSKAYWGGGVGVKEVGGEGRGYPVLGIQLCLDYGHDYQWLEVLTILITVMFRVVSFAYLHISYS